MAPMEPGGSRLGPAESGDQFHQAGDALGESRRLSQACVCLYVCRVVVQQARLWPVELLMLMFVVAVLCCSRTRYLGAAAQAVGCGG